MALSPGADRPAATAAVSAPALERLLELVDLLQDRPVLLVVDLVVDRFLYGTPKRVSREAPVLILQHDSERRVLGGGANAAANVRALGGRPLVVGRVGDDREGEALLGLLEGRDIETDLVTRIPGWETPTKTRILGGAPHTVKQQIVRYDHGIPRPLSELEVREVESRLAAAVERLRRSAVDGARIAVCSDYGYGLVDPALVPALRRSLGPDPTLLVDSRYRLGDFHGLDGATPNQEEAEALAASSLETEDELVAAAPRLLERLDSRFLVVTRGSEGMVLFERAAEGVRCGFLPAAGASQVTDVTGAGDTVIATLGLTLAAGGSALEAATLANYAAGVVVTKAGTATVSPDELRSALRADPRPLSRMTVR